ncbi:P2Y purinoceptor 14 [Oryzias melastigma]|uniref:P2Y purinoceptor 14-like n=1 Tax=Oryzias melastigma TaxID=30732 RepID=A0A3B3CJD9_ORYME|nr:P2Y purinoceptor 14 [Oryzias melastigma]
MNHSGGSAVSSSQTSPKNETDPGRAMESSAHIFFMVAYSLLFAVGLLLNGFTLKVYFCRAQQRMASSVTIYLKNLAVSDFFLSLCLPIRIANFSFKSLAFRKVYCSFGASAFYLNMYASILFMGYIATNRYLKIVHPVGNHFLQTRRAAHILSIVTWAVLLSMTGSYAVLSAVLVKENVTAVPPEVSCDFLQTRDVDLLYKVIHAICFIVFLLVLASLVFLYSSISRRVLMMQRRPSSTSTTSKLSKSRRNMLVLVSVFCVCFVPYHLIRLPYAFNKNVGRLWGMWFTNLKEMGVMLSACNVCLDPLIYFIFCKAFRAQLMFKKVFDTTEASTPPSVQERRTSDGYVRYNRKLSLTSLTKHSSMA